MASRSYTNRQDFRGGWNLSVNRYADPGGIAFLYNTMLDPLALGALRTAYGVVPFGFTGTINQNTLSVFANGRYPGICHISRIKEADAGGYDTICVGMAYQEGSPRSSATTTSAKFYLLAPPDTATMKMNFPFGKGPFLHDMKTGDTFFIYPFDLIQLFGANSNFSPPAEYPQVNTISLAGVGTASTYTFGGVRYDAPGAGGPPCTLTIGWKHGYTGEAATTTHIISFIAGTYSILSPVYITQSPPKFFPRGFRTSSYSGLKGETYNFYGIIRNFTESSASGFIADTTTLTDISPFVVGDTQSFGRFEFKGGSFSIGATTKWIQDEFNKTHSIDVTVTFPSSSSYTKAVNIFPHLNTPQWPNGDQGSIALKKVHEVSNIVQSTATPYGIWKNASINGFSYFFDGLSTPFRLRESDPFGVTTTYSKTVGLDRPDLTTSCSVVSPAATGSVEGIVRYFIAYLDEELNEGPLSPYFPNYYDSTASTGYYSGTISEADREAGWAVSDSGSVQLNLGMAPATVSKIRIYRTMKDRGSPFFLKDVDYAAGTITVVDTLSDLELGDLPFTHGDPPPTTFFSPVVYYDRLWGLGTRQGVADSKRTYLFWSDINAPESFFWDGNYAAVYAEDGDEGTALVRDRSGLVIFKNNHAYRMVGRTPDDINFYEITTEDSDSGVGCPHPNAVVATARGTFFYWQGAVYLYTDGGAVDISKPISPILKGRSTRVGTLERFNWDYHTSVIDSSVNLSFDPVHNHLFVAFQVDRGGAGKGNEDPPYMTLIFDVENAIWSGHMDGAYGFVRRYRVPIVTEWGPSSQDIGFANGLICASLGERHWGTSNKWRGIYNPTHLLMLTLDHSYDGKVPRIPDESYIKFRPLVGNLGPYASKRFLWIDYLADANNPYDSTGTGSITSTLYLDGNLTGDTDKILIGQGVVYADRLRHVSGNLATEVEPKVSLAGSSQGDVIRMLEYSVTWQNIGKWKTSDFSQPTNLTPGWMR